MRRFPISDRADGRSAVGGSTHAPRLRPVLPLRVSSRVPQEGDPHGPRNGSYTYLGEPGLGGTLQFADSLILLCPDNPQSLVADTQTVARWYRSSGAIHGRADALASGGQIPKSDDWVGSSCHNGVAGQATTAANESGYWMFKLESAADGSTVAGSAQESSDPAAHPCDPALGKVPALTDSSSDFDFTQKTVTFPGEW
jgi:hypothetical protein